MFKNIFKKNAESEETLIDKIENIVSVAKSFGLDVPKEIEKEIPKLVRHAKDVQDRAGCPLFITISLDDNAENFVLALYKMLPTGADIIKSYRLTDPLNLINQIQQDLNSISDDTDTPQLQPIAIGSPDSAAIDTGTEDSTTAGNID